uniref:Uncharacterized protein n=1 Tax=Tetranychus urticae TaxID=32264 RepID=T1JVN8_TETUR
MKLDDINKDTNDFNKGKSYSKKGEENYYKPLKGRQLNLSKPLNSFEECN